MINLAVKENRKLILDALEKKNNHEVTLYGNDGDYVKSGRLWMFSPVVRSILDQSQKTEDSAFVFPDFIGEELKEAVKVIETNKQSMIMISKASKIILEILGLEFGSFLETVIDVDTIARKDKPAVKVKIEKNIALEDERLLVDDIQKVLLDENIAASDDEGEVEGERITSTREEIIESQNTNLNPSADESEENLTDQNEINSGLESEEDISEAGEFEAKPSDEMTQHQKMEEVENLLVREDGQWKCKICNKIKRDKTSLRMHAETHISGLVFKCENCEEVCTTKSRLNNHIYKKHRGIEKMKRLKLKKESKKKLNPNTTMDADTLKQKQGELEKMLIKEGKGVWKCRVCSKTFGNKTLLRYHAEKHVVGLEYKCEICSKNFSNRLKLRYHKKKIHTN